jgi:starch-binding outer membrane protein, SusD/RagB family
MKKNVFYLLIITAFFSASCKKFLDREPLSQSTDANFWKNEKEANSGIAGGYTLIRNSLNEASGMAHYAYGDLPSGEFITGLSNADFAAVSQMNLQLPLSISDLTRNLIRLRRWDNFYKAIDQANRCIKFIPTIPLDQYTSSNPLSVQQRLVGEAYFMRAFNYFYMARIWGDVPLVLETTPDPTQAEDLPRTSQSEILSQCIKDIQTAIPALTWNYPVAADRAVRANRGAAYALLAHIYAWQGDYEKSASAADSVILKGGYSYVDRSSSLNYLSIYKGKSSEGIFEIAQSATNEGTAQGIALNTLKAPYLSTNTGNSVYPLDKETLYKLFTDSGKVDLRAKNAFAFLGTADPICIKYANVTYTSTNSAGQPTSPIFLNNIVIFRYSDIKLLRAEALAASNNNTEARNILNEIRSKAGLANYAGTDANLFEAIIDERGRELFLEGHRFYDLVRLAKKTGVLKFDASGSTRMSAAQFQQGKYYWPVEPYLIYINPKLVQTPYWADKM